MINNDSDDEWSIMKKLKRTLSITMVEGQLCKLLKIKKKEYFSY